MKKTVLVAMSGGVDSSVAALLLVESGYRVIGVTLRLFESCGNRSLKTCCSLEDAFDARGAANFLGIEHRVLECQELFHRLVVDNFVREYAAGRTPNPCILCNEKIKFGVLLEHAHGLGAGAVATGHYARIGGSVSAPHLMRGADPEKDQSYSLFSLSSKQLSMTLFPLGDLRKEQVKKIAESAGLPTASKRESQDICFAPEGDYSSFVERSGLVPRAGKIMHSGGGTLGEHRGFHRYTVGQRKGLGIPYAEPLYVLSIDPKSAEIVVGSRKELLKPQFFAEPWLWRIPKGSLPDELLVQTRYRQKPALAKILESPRGAVVSWVDEPLCAAPGQAAVAYWGDCVSGGGWIL